MQKCFNELANSYLFSVSRYREAQNIEQLNMAEHSQLEKEVDAVF